MLELRSTVTEMKGYKHPAENPPNLLLLGLKLHLQKFIYRDTITFSSVNILRSLSHPSILPVFWWISSLWLSEMRLQSSGPRWAGQGGGEGELVARIWRWRVSTDSGFWRFRHNRLYRPASRFRKGKAQDPSRQAVGEGAVTSGTQHCSVQRRGKFDRSRGNLIPRVQI